jgi:hypothetical protein
MSTLGLDHAFTWPHPIMLTRMDVACILRGVKDANKNQQSCRKEYLGALYSTWHHNVKWCHYVIVLLCSSFLCIEAMGKCDYNLHHLKCIMAGACGQYYEEIFGTYFYQTLLCFKLWWGPFCSSIDFYINMCRKESKSDKVSNTVYILLPMLGK